MRLLPSRQALPLAATVLICGLLYAIGAVSFQGFFSARVFVNFISDNAFLGITAVGITFVILSGGIDLSVGAVIGCTSVILAKLIGPHHLPPLLAIGIVLAAGCAFGAAMGCLIRSFDLPPFLVTLAGLFFCRGLGLLISEASIPINHPVYERMSEMALPLPAGLSLPLAAMVFLCVIAVAIYISRSTRFGRNCYALGGGEQSAALMGLPVGATKIGVYALSGFCAALAGVVYTINTPAGLAIAGTNLELDAIAAVVVGGTLLSGAGSVIGTFLGVLIFGVIQTGITFQGTLGSGRIASPSAFFCWPLFCFRNSFNPLGGPHDQPRYTIYAAGPEQHRHRSFRLRAANDAVRQKLGEQDAHHRLLTGRG